MNTRVPGFSLVELSIVLVILGLLVGGILTGQSLIRASELRSVTSQQTKFQTGISAFRDKYFAIPGDMANATSFWGFAGGSTGTDATCYNASSTSSTCNGSGNGIIDNAWESRLFWQHLANAGLIEGTFDASSSTGTYTQWGQSARNTPQSRIADTSYRTPLSYGSLLSAGGMFDGYYGNIFQLGGYVNTTNNANKPIFVARDLWNIDTKTDDGKPATGWLVVRWWAAGCATTTTTSDLTGTYALDNDKAQCTAIWRRQF